MPVRPPSAYAPKSLADPLQAALEHEILSEKASTLGRLLRELEKRLADLRDYEQPAVEMSAGEDPAPPSASDPIRRQKIEAAGNALWHVVIQRDLCGLRQTEKFLADMKVPKSVRLRMGVVARR